MQSRKYRITVEAPGFKRFAKQDITLSSTERLSVGTLVLEVGAITESITVSGERTPVQISNQER